MPMRRLERCGSELVSTRSRRSGSVWAASCRSSPALIWETGWWAWSVSTDSLDRGSGWPAAERVRDCKCPLLGLFGGADQAIPVEQVEQFDAALGEAGIEREIHVYPGAPHSFFDRRFEEHADASEDAWRRMLRFLDRHG